MKYLDLEALKEIAAKLNAECADDVTDDVQTALDAISHAVWTIEAREYTPAQSERNRQLEDARS